MIIPKSIQEFNNILKIEKINKGYSDDEKYYIELEGGGQFLLKVSSIDSLDFKKEEFESTKLVYETGIPMSKPINLYHIGNKIFTIFSWCPGEELNTVLTSISSIEQYELGVRAGKYLKRIHSIELDMDYTDWYNRFKSKKNLKIKNYISCELSFEGDQKMIDYLNHKEGLLKNRPQVFHHGDFHPGNMIYNSHDDELYIIDFNRFDYGDPFEEFNRIDFAASISPAFATGQIDGYFDNDPPKIFFDLLLYYISSNALSSLPWAIPFGQKEVKTMLDKIQMILLWFDNMDESKPTWYKHNF